MTVKNIIVVKWREPVTKGHTFIWCPESLETEGGWVFAGGWRKGGMAYDSNVYRVFFGGVMKIFWDYLIVIDAQLSEYIKTHELYTLKG